LELLKQDFFGRLPALYRHEPVKIYAPKVNPG